MDFHAITSRGTELLLQVVDDQLIIVPPAGAAVTAAPAARADDGRYFSGQNHTSCADQ
jgi:hypothetical protein